MSLVSGGAQEGEKGEEGGGLATQALKSPGRTLEGSDGHFTKERGERAVEEDARQSQGGFQS